MSQHILYLDIETIPCQKPGLLEEIRATIQPPGNISKPETIVKWMAENKDSAAEEAYRKTALNGTQGEIVCIGYAGAEGGASCTMRSLGESEGDMLQNFFDTVDKHHPHDTLVGHNVLGFDLRFIFQRAVILGVKPSFPLRQDDRYNGERVYDTMLAWAGWGNRIKLSTICEALGIPVKTGGIDGSQVWDYVKAGKIAEVAEYCKEDVEAVRQVHRRMTFAG